MRILFVFGLFFSVHAGAQTLVPNDTQALLKGKVTNFKGVPLRNEVILFVNERSKSVTSAHTNSLGNFEILIPNNATYAMKYKNFVTDVDYTKMVVPADKDATYEVGIKIDPPKEYVLQNVHFESGSAKLKPSSFKALSDLVEILKIKNTLTVEIQGHTDNIGSDSENLDLSQKRAEAVRDFLISKGIDKQRVSAKGYGQSMPVADNSTEEGRARNRRTGLRVMKE